MKLKEILILRNKKAKELATAIKLDEPMISKFANYKCLPVPRDMETICRVLGCGITDIYEESEVFYKKNAASTQKRVNAATKYSLHVLLPKEARKVLSKENLQRAGYKNLTHWVWNCYKELLIEMKKSCPKSLKHSSSAKDIAPKL